MKCFPILMALLVLIAAPVQAGLFGEYGRPTVKGEGDAVAWDESFAAIYYSVAAGVGLEQFLGASSTEELLLSGDIAYETPDGFWFEFGAASIGDEEPDMGTKAKAGLRLFRTTFVDFYGGAEVLRNGVNRYGAFAFLRRTLSPAHDVRLLAEYEQEGGIGLTLGFMFVEVP